jgi:hypothetical protein
MRTHEYQPVCTQSPSEAFHSCLHCGTLKNAFGSSGGTIFLRPGETHWGPLEPKCLPPGTMRRLYELADAFEEFGAAWKALWNASPL